MIAARLTTRQSRPPGRVIVVAAALLAVTAVSAHAASPPRHDSDEPCRYDGWQLLGRLAPGKDEPRVLDASHFRGYADGLRFKAEGDTVTFRSIRIFTGPMPPVVIPLHRLKPGEISRSFPLPGDAGVIRRVEIVARSDSETARVVVCVRPN
jgi:hypothetical protein